MNNASDDKESLNLWKKSEKLVKLEDEFKLVRGTNQTAVSTVATVTSVETVATIATSETAGTTGAVATVPSQPVVPTQTNSIKREEPSDEMQEIVKKIEQNEDEVHKENHSVEDEKSSKDDLDKLEESQD